MSQPTEIVVLVDNTEYSRYETDRDTISVTVQTNGGAPYSDEDVLVELVKARRSRDAVVATDTVTFSSATDPDVMSTTFYLPDLVDQDMLNLVRHGRYFMRASSAATVAEVTVGDADSAPIVIETVETGTDYNSWTAEVVIPAGTEEMFVTAVGGVITVSLGTNGGVPVASKNTREQIVAFISANLVDTITASFSGTAGLSLSTAQAATLFSGARDEVYGESEDFDIRIVTIERLKRDFLFGIPLTASMARSVRTQPTNITGVTVTEVSSTHPLGLFPLTYTYHVSGSDTIRQISWNGGPVVSLVNPGTYVLRKGNGGSSGACGGKSGLLAAMQGMDYMIIRVAGPTFLPTANALDELLIEQLRMNDITLGKYLDESADWLENVALGIYLEPTTVVTDRDPTMIQFAAGINSPNPIFTDPDYDFLVGPLTYFSRQSSWIDVQTPFPQLLRVDSLFGSIANTRIIDIDLDWIQFYPVGGLVQLVPFNQAIAFDFIGLLGVNALRGNAPIPNFWHFNMVAGLRDCTADLQELLAKKAAMDALIVLGTALRPGVGSVSLGRDGVSQSVSYLSTQQYGPYTGAINGFKEWIDDQLVKFKGKYRGPTLVVV